MFRTRHRRGLSGGSAGGGGGGTPVFDTYDTTRTYGGVLTYSGAGLIATRTSTLRMGTAQHAKSTGIWGFEFVNTTDAGQQSILGMVRDDVDFTIDSYPGQATRNGFGYYQGTLFKGVDGSQSVGGVHVLNQGDVVTIVVNFTLGTFKIWVNGVALFATYLAIPGWSAGKAYMPAIGTGGGSGVVRFANADATSLSVAGAVIILAAGANAGWYELV